ncbi:hypothetical protein Poli38472_004210 [Pythium oligandrum]|uniref:Uncharacterized protein n=1 Tax=Pythium oligandrum TaxID=41045 RepID=A0A8K1CN86_PYTOL|nr:hypothetical protein Poli38472_004210 [Pythium oligandrum]|eukprot:TMW66445.1 hypothetical protein Poli38472_004210 [Pythium oligandrum]
MPLEFLPIEVYYNEVSAAENATSSNEVTDDVTDLRTSANESSVGEENSSPRRVAINRPNRVLRAEFLPPIAGKGAAFETFRVVVDKGVFGGRHDGTILHWKIQQRCSITPLNASHLYGHSGAVLALEFTQSTGKDGLLFSGSADRTIKVWDPWRGSEAEQQLHGKRHDHFCVQTITAHQASVTALKLLTQNRNGFISCSLDQTIKIWHPSEGRGLLLYPWFTLVQSISLTSGHWPTSLCVRDAASCSLFVGDSSGSVSHYTNGVSFETMDDQPDYNGKSALESLHDTSPRDLFKLKRKHTQFHSLGVVQLQLIAENSFVVSLGFDQTAQVLDPTTSVISSTIRNRNPVRFTSCAWDSKAQLLFLADALGYVHLWDIFQDKWIKKEKLFPSPLVIVSISLQIGADWMFVGIKNGLKHWKIDRDVRYGEFHGHKDTVVALAVIKDEVLMEESPEVSEDHSPATSSRFFSSSLDQTIRCWDSYDVKAVFGFEERHSEITCMVAAKKFSKVVTGHENGCIKAWGIYTGQFLTKGLPSKSAVTCVTTCIIRDQEFIITGDVDGSVCLWELNLDSIDFSHSIQVNETKERREEVTALLFSKGDYISPQGGAEYLVIGFCTGDMAIWSFSSKHLIKSWKAHDDAICTLVRHGSFVFSGSDDSLLRIWNCFHIADPYELGVLRPPGVTSSSGTASPIIAIDVVPESGAVLSGAADGTIIVWGYKDFEDSFESDFDAYGKILFRSRLNYPLRCLQYWPSQKSIICGTNEGRIVVLPLPAQVFHTPPLPFPFQT